MSKEKYFFNPDTLSFEKEQFTTKAIIRKHTLFTLRACAIAICLYIVLNITSYSPKYYFLNYSNQQLVESYHKILTDFGYIESELNRLQKNDEMSYRLYAGLGQLPDEIRMAGIGGAESYNEQMGFSNMQIVNHTLQTADSYERKLLIQKESFNDVYEKIREKETQLASVPGIMPMLSTDVKRISDIFGMRFHPIFHTRRMHYGIDYSASIGTPVYCPGDGVIDYVGYEAGYGKLIIMNHGYGIISIYGHLNEILVAQGQKVNRGVMIGKVGDTGSSTGPHLHYEIRVNNNPVNPAHYYLNDLSPKEYLMVLNQSARKHPKHSS